MCQKRKQLRFSEVNYLNYTKKTQFLHVTAVFSLKRGETRTSSGPIPHPLMSLYSIVNKPVQSLQLFQVREDTVFYLF